MARVLIFLATSGYDGCTYTWLEISHGSGIPRSWLDSVQTGRVTDPPLSRTLALADFFHVSLDALARVIADESLSLPDYLISTISSDAAQARFRALRRDMWEQSESNEERERRDKIAARRAAFGMSDT